MIARWRADRGLWVVALLAALLVVPLVVALVALRRPQWFPVLDMAMTEFRVRDVGTSHTPLIGLPGRIGTLAEQGSHPGPLSFYALAPFYRLLGSSAWAMQAGMVVLQAGAVATTLAVVRRRGGVPLVVAMAALLAMVMNGYGTGTLTQPWNPYLPVLWWVVLLVAVWSVLCDDLVLLPLAVAAASFCAQTHIPYLAGSVVLCGLAFAAAGRYVRRRPSGTEERRRGVLLVGGSVALGVVLWLPPLVDQAIRDPGNVSVLVEHFTDPPEEPVGLATGVEVGLERFDLLHLAVEQGDTGSLVVQRQRDQTWVPGAFLVAVWAGAVVVAWRLRHERLLRLHLVVAVGLVLAVVSISRVFGVVWYYLSLWVWGIAALMVVATVWSFAAWVAPRLGDAARERVPRLGVAAMAVVAVVATGLLVADAPDTRYTDAELSDTLGRLVPDVARALDDGAGAATGDDGRYLVTWDDVLAIGSQGYGLVSELERRGFDVGALHERRVPFTSHRVLAPEDATARLVLATGSRVDAWREHDDAVEVAYVEPRDRAGREEYERLRREVIDDLRAAGLDDLVDQVDTNLFGAAIDTRLDEATQTKMERMSMLGLPTAVFVAPPGASL